MIELVVVFLVLAMIAGFLGFSGVSFMSIEIARTLFYVFLLLLAVSVIYNLFFYKRPPLP